MKTLLIIDDEPDFRALLSQLVEASGWRVLQAADGAIGFELALLHRPAVVICDLLMPRCNGFQTCRAIRERRELDHTKIVITTGRGYTFDRNNSLAAGANEYLEKPIDTQALLAILSRFEKEISGAKPPSHSQPDRDDSASRGDPRLAVARPAERDDQRVASIIVSITPESRSIVSNGRSTRESFTVASSVSTLPAMGLTTRFSEARVGIIEGRNLAFLLDFPS